MSLKEELDLFAAQTKQASPDYESWVEELIADLEAEFDGEQMLKVGDTAPLFTLPSATGEQVSLKGRLDHGPVILSFYRGGWCPYCNLELRAYQALLGDIQSAGASLLAISPQSPDDSLTTAEKENLSFDVLSDHGSTVAGQYGIAFELGGSLKIVQKKSGYDLTQLNAAKDWRIPVPATLVIGTDGEIKLAHVDLDYRNRLEPAHTLEVLRSL